jgi:tRNA(Ile)-lysidine synthase TilS/MesJ
MIKFSKEIMDLAFRKMPKFNSLNVLCSMGVDSVAAAHYCVTKLGLGKKYDFLISPRHFNHALRKQNDLMETSYISMMFENGFRGGGYPPINLKKAGFYGNAVDKTEDTLRQARLEYIKKNIDCTILITGHHLDDATESYMMNVLRGKEGYLPIPFVTEVGTNLIVHPFLFTKKADFRQYAERKDLMKFVVEDETNKVTKGSRRNFIRNEIIPLLQREKMGIDTIVRKKMEERLALELLKD